MSNVLLSEYHVWAHGKHTYAVVDTYYQEVVYSGLSLDSALAKVEELRGRLRGSYPSIIEAS
jgi:hypothetical protein